MSNKFAVYGKLPGHGDFVHRNLSGDTLSSLDGWMQHFAGSAKERMGDAWLDIYLTSPMWRFALSSGCINDQQYVGVLMPSVDRVGRYFPFVFLLSLYKTVPLLNFLMANDAWFSTIESFLLKALSSPIAVDEFLESAAQIDPPKIKMQTFSDVSAVLPAVSFVENGDADFSPSAHNLCEHVLRCSGKAFSVWQTKGSQAISPVNLVSEVLPSPQQVCAMMDGNWEHWQWSMPLRFPQS